ncbi:probable apyrase 6 [Telopea speciosissima]|uniref:probable apyrase 6 n=1 Tax=Telopea speciosissima TaxID=54955 RepID=UPI001CC3BB42|nr:probable apyrase 6 [Telopea speciosissima]
MDYSNLQSRVSAAYIPPHRTQLHPRMHSFSSFASPNPKPSQIASSQSRDKWWILVTALLMVPFLFYLFAIARGVHQSSKFSESRPKGFGVIIDAGSTGSRVHVFEFLNEGRIPFIGFDGKGSHSFKVRPGLSEFDASPESAGSSISGLLEFAKARIPKSEWKLTKVRLMARGSFEKISFDARKAILESCRRVLRSSGFLFKDEWASVITGQEEGLYAWVAANYALGTLGDDPQKTTGIIELGSASFQVTFAPREPPPIEFSRMLKIAGVTYNLYTQSMLHFGQDGAWESLLELHNSKVLTSFSSSDEGIIMNPCIPKGYPLALDSTIGLNASNEKPLASHSVGNFSACRSEVVALLQKGKDKCMHPPCNIVSSFLPQLQGKAVSPLNFFYTSEFFGLVPKASLSELELAGVHYCEDDWSKLKEEHHGIDEVDLLRYCFSSAFIVALLHDSLRIPMDDKRIGFANEAGSSPFDWTLGAFILQTVEPLESEPENLGHIVGNDTVTYLSLFAILFLAAIAAFYVSKWRKPQLKTVYDLEKGHYIITRVPR